PRVLTLLAAGSVAGLVVAAFGFLRALGLCGSLAGALALPLPLWPAVQEATRANFHPETIGICAALLAGWAGPRGRTVLCWLAALAMVGCAGALPLLRPAWLALALPPLLADLLSAHGPQPFLHLQYGLPLVVPMLAAAAIAARAWAPAAARLVPALALAPIL